MLRLSASLPRTIAGLALGLALGLATSAAAAPTISGRAKVHDGDTLTVSGVKIRLYGIDAPELSQVCQRRDGKSWDCGKWARDRLERYAVGKVVCTPLDRDRYGRTVARCRSEAGDMGERMVREGAAVAYRQYSTDYVDAEKQASLSARGIWDGRMERPDAWRAEARAAQAQRAPQAGPGNCRIKGNISKSGRIYHRPQDRSWADTRIDTAKGERWFCTEAEARAAGWRPARN